MDMTNWGTRARCRGKDLGTMRLNSSRGLSRLLGFFSVWGSSGQGFSRRHEKLGRFGGVLSEDQGGRATGARRVWHAHKLFRYSCKNRGGLLRSPYHCLLQNQEDRTPQTVCLNL